MTTENQLLRDALHRIKHDAVSLADAQVIALEALTQPAQAGEIAAWAQDEQFALAISDGAHIATTVTIYKDRQPRFANTALYTTPPASQEQATDATILRYFAPWLPHPANDDDKQDLIKSARACFAKAPCGCRVGECESKADAHCRMTDEVHHQASQQPSGGEVADAPERIWLQINADGSPEDTGYPSDHEGVTWCWHSIGGQEVEYVRADLAKPQSSGGEVVQWQKRHPMVNDGQWLNTNGPDAKWWRDNCHGWAARALTLATKPEPMTDEQAYDLFGVHYQMGIIRAVEAHHGIKRND